MNQKCVFIKYFHQVFSSIIFIKQFLFQVIFFHFDQILEEIILFGGKTVISYVLIKFVKNTAKYLNNFWFAKYKYKFITDLTKFDKKYFVEIKKSMGVLGRSHL